MKEAKIVLIGDSNIGKTSFVNRIRTGKYDEYESTIGVMYSLCKVFVHNQEIKLNIWDTAGQERFNSFVPMYIRNANVVLVCFTSYDVYNLNRYVLSAIENANNSKVILVGMKKDLDMYNKDDSIKVYAKQNELELFLVSSKTGEGIAELCIYIADCVYNLEEKIVDRIILPRQEEDKNISPKCYYCG